MDEMDEYEREEILSKVAEEIFATVSDKNGPPEAPTEDQVRQVKLIVNVKNKEVLRKYNIQPWEVVEYLDRKTRKGLPGYKITKDIGMCTESWVMDNSLMLSAFSIQEVRRIIANRMIVEKMSEDWIESLVGGFCSLGAPPRASTFTISNAESKLEVDLRVYSLTRPFLNEEAVATEEGSKALFEVVQEEVKKRKEVLVCLTRTDIGSLKMDSQVSALFSHRGEIVKVAYYLAGEVAYCMDRKLKFPNPVKVLRTKEENIEYAKNLYGGRTEEKHEEIKRRRF